MLHLSFTSKSLGERYIRVSKREAEKRYNDGETIVFVPVNCSPSNDYYSLGIKGCINDWGLHYLKESERFNYMVNQFTFYNCNNETGRYPAYYTISELR